MKNHNIKIRQRPLEYLDQDYWTKRYKNKKKKRAANRKSQVGTGDRSERIRTYNFPQGRVSDHRINLNLYKLNEILSGSLDVIVDPLIADSESNKIASLNNE